MPNMSDSRIWFTTAVFRVSILKKYLILFGNFVETLLSDGLPKGAGCLKCLFLQPQFLPILINKIAFPVCARLLPAYGGWRLCATDWTALWHGWWCRAGIDWRFPPSAPLVATTRRQTGKRRTAARQRRYGRLISRRSFQIRVWTGAMVGYVYNLGTKKRNKCLLDNKVQTNSRQNKASIPFLH